MRTLAGFPLLLAGLAMLLLASPGFFEHARSVVGPRIGLAQGSPQFTHLEHGAPLRWQGCSSTLLLNPGPLGEQAVSDVTAVLAEIRALTGFSFDLQLTGETPRYAWALSRPGSVPPPVIGFSSPEGSDLLDGSPGATVANPGTTPAGRAIVTGAVAIDDARYLELSDRAGKGATRRNLLLHELGHLLGLDHGPGLMDPALDGSTPDGFTAEEIQALNTLTSGCRP